MLKIRSLLPLSCLVVSIVGLGPRDPVALQFKPAAGSRLEFEFTQRLEVVEGADLVIMTDGVEREGWELDSGFEALVLTQRIVLLDTYAATATADGQPTQLDREFRELTRILAPVPDVEAERSVSASELAGRHVRFEFDPRTQNYAATSFIPACEDPVHDLEGDVSLGGFLPEGPVEIGAEWAVDVGVLQGVLRPGGDLGLTDPAWAEVPPDHRDEDQLLALRGGLVGEVHGTFEGQRIEGGRTVYRIALRARVTGERSWLAFEGPESHRTQMTADLVGWLDWDLEHERARALHLSGPVEITIFTELEIDGFGQTELVEATARRAATLELGVRVSEPTE